MINELHAEMLTAYREGLRDGLMMAADLADFILTDETDESQRTLLIALRDAYNETAREAITYVPPKRVFNERQH